MQRPSAVRGLAMYPYPTAAMCGRSHANIWPHKSCHCVTGKLMWSLVVAVLSVRGRQTIYTQSIGQIAFFASFSITVAKPQNFCRNFVKIRQKL